MSLQTVAGLLMVNIISMQLAHNLKPMSFFYIKSCLSGPEWSLLFCPDLPQLYSKGMGTEHVLRAIKVNGSLIWTHFQYNGTASIFFWHLMVEWEKCLFLHTKVIVRVCSCFFVSCYSGALFHDVVVLLSWRCHMVTCWYILSWENNRSLCEQI